ncbi:MAG: porin [Granulosicoccus sp.]|nr:porin [Granulosicoccus sp.]
MDNKLLKVGLVACALVPAMALAQQDITSELDASVRFGLGLNTEPDTDLSVRNYSSRIRWAGSADVDENLKIVSYLELGLDQDSGVDNTRHGWLGVTGDFGTVTAGKQYDAFYDAVTSKVDVAYWDSCNFEIGCERISSTLKYASVESDGLQFMGSALLLDGDDEVLNGFDLGAKFSSGELELGVGVSYLNERIVQDENNLILGTVDDGFAIGASAAIDLGGSTASATLQFADEDYAIERDGVYGATLTYSTDQYYGLFTAINGDNRTPFSITGGYVMPIIQDRALVYIEVGLRDDDVEGQSTDFNARSVLVFNFGKISGG